MASYRSIGWSLSLFFHAALLFSLANVGTYFSSVEIAVDRGSVTIIAAYEPRSSDVKETWHVHLPSVESDHTHHDSESIVAHRHSLEDSLLESESVEEPETGPATIEASELAVIRPREAVRERPSAESTQPTTARPAQRRSLESDSHELPATASRSTTARASSSVTPHTAPTPMEFTPPSSPAPESPSQSDVESDSTPDMPPDETAGATVDSLPTKLPANPAPAYPADAVALRREGVVLLAVTVGADGRVTDIQLAESSGYDPFDASALRTVRTWRFSPAMRNGIPVPFTVNVPIRFSFRKPR